MTKIGTLLLPFISALLASMQSGCSTTLARMDQQNLRGSMMIYQEDQIMDNLIRAYNYLPIAHFDVETMDAQVKTSGSAKLNAKEAIKNAVSGFVDVTRDRTGDIGASRDNTISLNVKLVKDKNSVYAAYFFFVHVEKGLFRATRGEPVPKDAIIYRKWRDGHTYYVPKEFGPQFFRLSLRAAVWRGDIVGADTPLDIGDLGPSGSRARPKGKTPLSLPANTPALQQLLERDNSLQGIADELRKLRLLQ